MKAIADMTAGAIPPDILNKISDYLNDWDNVNHTDRRFVADGLIERVLLQVSL